MVDKYEGRKINHKPKMFESTLYKVSYIAGNKIEESQGFKDVYYFDKDGRKIKYLAYNSDGSQIMIRIHYLYNNMGKLKKFTSYNLDSSVKALINYTYNKQGQLLKEESISYLKEKRYDIKKRIVETKSTHIERGFKEKYIQKFNHKWQDIEHINFDELGNFKSRTEYEYDNKGNLIGMKIYNKNNNLRSIYKGYFNKYNDRVKVENFTVIDGNIKRSSKYEMRYIYDNHDNWIEQHLITNGKISFITRIKISYYYN